MSIVSVIGRFLVRLLPKDNQLLYRFCRRVFHLDNGDNNDDLRTNGERVLIQRALPTATVVFDVGANVGDWTVEALKINERAEYHLFEPSPTTFELLRKRSFPTSVILNNVGLGDKDGETELFVFGEGLGANSLYDRTGTDAVEQRRERVRITTIDTYCSHFGIGWIDFLKIDVEGHELQVLKGAATMLREQRIGVIQFEYGGTYIDARCFLKDVWDLIGRVDSQRTFFKLHHDGPRRVVAYRQELETFQYSNWVIAGKEHTKIVEGR